MTGRRTRLAACARWLAPSVVAACLGAAVAGVVEGLAAGFGAVGAPASAGFAALLAAPALLAGAMIVRGLWAAWRPGRLAPGLVEDGGGAPRLAAWVAFLLGGALVLSWATFNGVRLIARLTTFKLDVVALALPAIVVTFAALLAAVSRPSVDALAVAVRRVDARARRRLGRSLATPRLVLAGAVAAVIALALVTWRVSVAPRIGPLDLGILLYPVIAIAVAAAVHPAWRRLPPRAARWGLAAPAAAATVAIALAATWVRHERASLMLSVWSQPTIAGLAIDTLYDVDDLRSRATLQRYRPARRPGAAPRDVVLITIDTVRYDRTPLGGGPAPMPTLAALGRRGAVFHRAFAPGNVTRRSMPAMMLGASPPRIRGRVVGWALRLDPRHVPLAERLDAAGYDTAGFFCCASFWERDRKTGYARGLDELVIDPDGEVLAAAAAAWIRDRGARAPSAPSFVWMHLLEPHNWMKRPDGGSGGGEAKDSRLRRYDKALADVDRFLAEVLAAIDALPEERRPIVIVTSDHGEGLGDHGAPYHSSDLYDSQLRVPLVIAGPGIAARAVDEPVSLTDLAPTILDLAGFVPPGMPDMDGRSLAALATGARAPDPDGGGAYAVMMQDRSSSQSARAVVRGRWKLIDGPKGIELYDLWADPGEQEDLAAERPEVRAELEALLAERLRVDAIPTF